MKKIVLFLSVISLFCGNLFCGDLFAEESMIYRQQKIKNAQDTDISGEAAANILIYDGVNTWDNKSLSVVLAIHNNFVKETTLDERPARTSFRNYKQSDRP